MKTVFVTSDSDAGGIKALDLLSKKGYETQTLGKGQQASEGSIAIFTAPEKLRRSGQYLIASAVKMLDELVPTWVHTTPFRIAICTTEDRKKGSPKHRRLASSFAVALENIATMYADWFPGKVGRSLPWADLESDPSIKANAAYIDLATTWLTKVQEGQAGRESKLDLNRAIQILKELNSLGGYYVVDPSKSLKASPDFMMLTQAQLTLCQKNGQAIFELWRQTGQIYALALQGKLGNRHLEKMIVQGIEGPLTNHQQQMQRRVALAQVDRLPLIARADLSSIWFLLEIQERCGGLGLVSSWLNAIRNVAPAVNGSGRAIGKDSVPATIATLIKDSTGKENPVAVLICPSGYEVEQNFLAEKLQTHGVSAVVVLKDQLAERLKEVSGNHISLSPDGPEVDFIYRREVAAYTLADSEIGMAIIDANLQGNIVVEPPLSMIFDSKVPLAMVHNPELKTFFSEEVRGVVSPTALMPSGLDDPFYLDGQTHTLREVIGKPFVVKYAGPNIKMGLGGRAVYNTRDNGEGIDLGLSEIAQGQPWIIQPMDETRFPTRWLDKSKQEDGHELCQGHVAARMMIHYARLNNMNQTTIFAAVATNRTDNWKAIGNPGSVFQELRVQS